MKRPSYKELWQKTLANSKMIERKYNLLVEYLRRENVCKLEPIEALNTFDIRDRKMLNQIFIEIDGNDYEKVNGRLKK